MKVLDFAPFRGSYVREFEGAIHSTKISGNFGPKLNGSVRSNRKSFEKTGPPFEVVLFSRSDRSEFWLNGSRPELSHSKLVNRIIKITHAHNLHVKMLVFRPLTIKGKFFTTKFSQTILRNHLGFMTTSAIKLCLMQREG